MIKFASAAIIAIAMTTGAFAAQNAVSTPATQCNEAQMKQMQNSVDSIKDPAKKDAAQAELNTAEKFLMSNDPDGCMVHLTNASKFVTP
jgi:hypothetical protein